MFSSRARKARKRAASSGCGVCRKAAIAPPPGITVHDAVPHGASTAAHSKRSPTALSILKSDHEPPK
jgi:hypothetical protein